MKDYLIENFSTDLNKENRSKLYLTLAAIILFFLPVLQQIFSFAPSVQVNENRVKAQFPVFRWDEFLRGKYAEEISKYYTDHYGMRDQLVKVNNLFNYYSNINTNPKVVTGKNGWLYYLDEINDYRHIPTLSEPDINFIVDRLAKYQADLKKRGTDFVFVVAPNKSSIYPEYMSADIEVYNNKNNYELLMQALQKSGQVNYVVLKDELVRNKNRKEPIYFLTDTHWNWGGGYIAANTLLRYLDNGLKAKIDMPRISSYKVLSHNGDLNAMLGVKNETQWQVPEIKTNPETPKFGQKVFWYRDSFGEMLIPTVQPYFNETMDWYVTEKGFTQKIPDDYYNDTDLVILEIVERNIPILAGFNFDI